jgi:UDP-N-acetylmuramoylalanine--D-glutamate ligase
MNIQRFRPDIGLVLNLDPDHLDWHKDLDEYYGAKFNMFRAQRPEDHAVLNAQDEATKGLVPLVPSRVVYFNQTGKCHENPNVDACLAVSDILGLDRERSLKSLTDFTGIEHRLEEVPSRDGRRYINDSKSTNISSLVWALERMPKKVVLILGGKNKGGDFSTVLPLFREKTREIVLIGEATREILPVLKDRVPYVTAGSLREAVETARDRSSAGDIVLLSPGCASFDMFINYKDRGEQFKKLVSTIALPCPKPVSVS